MQALGFIPSSILRQIYHGEAACRPFLASTWLRSFSSSSCSPVLNADTIVASTDETVM